MEIIAPHPHPKAPLPHIFHTVPTKIQIQLPLHKPIYKPLKPIKIKSPPKKSNSKPITTTSDILHLMDSLKLTIPLDMYTSLIKECTKLADPLKANELHQHIRKTGIRLNLLLLNRILLMYVSCGCFEHARQLFDQIPVTDFNSWAVMIAGCVENGEHSAAIHLFISMLCEKKIETSGDHHLMNISFSGILVCVLKACLSTMDLELGMQVHGWFWKMGYSRNAALSSFLINFYGKFRCLESAQTVFKQAACSSNTVAWTSRIVNYCNDDNFEGAINIFKDMGREGVRKNAYTFSSVLKACGKTGDISCGRQVHGNAMKLGLESDGFVQCTLVDLYGKCGLLKDATRMFEISGNKRNSACCNAILASYVQHGLCTEAMRILNEMKSAGLKPKESSFSELNLVCGHRQQDGLVFVKE